MRESGGWIRRNSFYGQERLSGSGDALGTPIQSHGQAVQRYLTGADVDLLQPGNFLFSQIGIGMLCYSRIYDQKKKTMVWLVIETIFECRDMKKISKVLK